MGEVHLECNSGGNNFYGMQTDCELHLHTYKYTITEKNILPQNSSIERTERSFQLMLFCQLLDQSTFRSILVLKWRKYMILKRTFEYLKR